MQNDIPIFIENNEFVYSLKMENLSNNGIMKGIAGMSKFRMLEEAIQKVILWKEKKSSILSHNIKNVKIE